MEQKTSMETQQEQIARLEAEIQYLSNIIYNHRHTDYDLTKKVAIISDVTPVATSTTNSTGRISVTINGTVRYIPYF